MFQLPFSTSVPSKGIQNDRVWVFLRGPCARRAPWPQPIAPPLLNSSPLLVPSTTGGTDAHEGAPGSNTTKLPPGPPPASTNNSHLVSPQSQEKIEERSLFLSSKQAQAILQGLLGSWLSNARSRFMGAQASCPTTSWLQWGSGWRRSRVRSLAWV